MLTEEEEKRLLTKLEFQGEQPTKREVRLGVYSGANLRYVEHWLSTQTETRAELAAERRDAREEESLTTAKDAASSAKAAALAATAAAASAAEATKLARQAKYISIAFAIITAVISIAALFQKK